MFVPVERSWSRCPKTPRSWRLSSARSRRTSRSAGNGRAPALPAESGELDPSTAAVFEWMGRSSGAPVSVSVFSLIRLRAGLIVEMTEYLTRGDALTAAGHEQW